MLTELDRKVSSYLANKNNTRPRFVASNGLQNIIDNTAEEIEKVLPHGSGIDCDWRVKHREDTTYCCYNSYHAMDGNGSYCGYISFMVVFDALTKITDVEVSQDDIDTILAGYADWEGDEDDPSPYLGDLDDYLYDTLTASLEYYCVKESIEFIRKSGCYFNLLEN